MSRYDAARHQARAGRFYPLKTARRPEIRRNARYRADEYEALMMVAPIDAGAVARQLRTALDASEAFVRAMLTGKEGLLFLQDAVAVQPEPSRLDEHGQTI